MHWRRLILALALAFATVTGCAQREFINQADYERFHRENALPLGMDANPALGAEPVTGREPAPADVNFPERKPRYISLAECIAIDLENGNTGIQSVRQAGTVNDDLQPGLSTGGYQFAQSDSKRVLSLNPAVSGLTIDAALAHFDAKWITTVGSSFVDQPVQGFNSFQNGSFGRFASSVVKGTSYGGLLGITFNTQYQNLSSPPRNFPLLNPAYTPTLQLTYEQSLWQGFGGINQLLARPVSLGNEISRLHPEASQFYQGHIAGIANQSAATGGGLNPTGILIARVRFDQSRAELERVVNFNLLNVETAYWNLYGAYVNLYSSEQALRQAFEAWRISKAKYEAGAIAITQFAQTRGQFEQFRGDRLQALGRVLEAERQLRNLMGLPIEDGTRLIPVDAPTLAPYQPDWSVAVEEALNLRPELIVARQELKTLQFDLMVQRNFLKPDLRLQSSYQLSALGTRLDGDGEIPSQSLGRHLPDNAFRGLASNHYNSWNLALNLNVPLGYRFENAAVRRARLALAQGYLAVKREEEKAKSFLAKAYRDVLESYKLIQARRAQRQAFAEQVEARFKEFVAGKTTADFLLEAQRQWANALSTEYQAIVAYNNSIAMFNFAKGTLMQHNNVAITEGDLPECVQVRAVDHERERSKALVLREHANLVAHPSVSPEHGVSGMPVMPVHAAPSVPALMDGAPKVPEKLEEAPAPAGKQVTQALRPAAKPATLPAPRPAGKLIPDTPRPAFPTNPGQRTHGPQAAPIVPTAAATVTARKEERAGASPWPWQ